VKDVGVKEVERVAEELVPIPGGDPDVEQRILPVLHGSAQVEGKGIGEHQAQSSEEE
jgi:hypothetical protein